MKQILSAFSVRDAAQVCTSVEGSTPEFSSSSDLERRIDHQAMLLHTVLTPDERRTAWAELTRLHAMRSPERVAAMEAERGLAR